MTALHWASCLSYTSIARLLLERGADIGAITDDGDTALHYAGRGGHITFIELLLEKIPLCGTLDLDARNMEGRTPLLSAASEGEKDAVVLLLKSRANISARENENRTALHLAVGAESLETVKVLLPKMSDIDLVAKTSDGSTALHIAAQEGFKEIVQELLQESLKDNPKVPRDYIAEKNEKRETALTIAADNTNGSTVFNILFALKGMSRMEIWKRTR
ncbi:ankyrin repeat-containing domain protein [Leptodontidium sp. 2 PMI_412]|nr:ankyrin repeat-containing domain protein [Leptodontidium sp. 2 PMI_412]